MLDTIQKTPTKTGDDQPKPMQPEKLYGDLLVATAKLQKFAPEKHSWMGPWKSTYEALHGNFQKQALAIEKIIKQEAQGLEVEEVLKVGLDLIG
eukprot:6654729-Alexandrium_andersonii.AAC.1